MDAPLYRALAELAQKQQLSFHMPGHGGLGCGFENPWALDVTELAETDNLHHAEGVIAEAQARAAALFGAKKTYFLVNGSTSGVLAMLLAFCGEGERVICDRYSHRSLHSALVFSGAVPLWIEPEAAEDGAMWGGMNPQTVARAVREHPNARAVFLTSPNYFGMVSDLAAIARIVHDAGMLLLVDSAHGAHFGLCDALPPSAISQGADCVVCSAHKTMQAFTQSAYLHTNIDSPRLEQALTMVQSTSPSYLLMASLDVARAAAEESGAEAWAQCCALANEFFPQKKPTGAAAYRDVTRLVLPLRGNPFHGAEQLRTEYGIAVECAYGCGIVCIAHPSHTAADFARLKRAVEAINRTAAPFAPLTFTPLPAETVVTPRAAFYAEKERCPLPEAEGRICGAEVMVYPPGVAQILPGERISHAALAQMQEIAARGAAVLGTSENTVSVLKNA